MKLLVVGDEPHTACFCDRFAEECDEAVTHCATVEEAAVQLEKQEWLYDWVLVEESKMESYRAVVESRIGELPRNLPTAYLRHHGPGMGAKVSPRTTRCTVVKTEDGYHLLHCAMRSANEDSDVVDGKGPSWTTCPSFEFRAPIPTSAVSQSGKYSQEVSMASYPAVSDAMTEDAFESQLFKLEALLRPLAETYGALESATSDGGTMEEACRKIAEVLECKPRWDNRRLTNDTWLMLGSQEALNITVRLIANWKMRQHGVKPHPYADMLIRLCERVGKIRPGPDAHEVMENTPWMLKTALNTLLNDDSYENDPAGGPAVAARILASILEVLEKVEGLNQQPRNKRALV